MKTFKLLSLALFAIVAGLVSCTDYQDEIDSLSTRVKVLEDLVDRVNEDVVALQTLVDAMEDGDVITEVRPFTTTEGQTGYQVFFLKHDPIKVLDGEDGKPGENAVAPSFTVGNDPSNPDDDNYYWFLNGQMVTDKSGNPIIAVGKNGKNGEDGQDGVNGHDGYTPKLKIENGMWYVSYDDGANWEPLVDPTTGQQISAKGADGSNAINTFRDVSATYAADGVTVISWTFTLQNGQSYTVPAYNYVTGVSIYRGTVAVSSVTISRYEILNLEARVEPESAIFKDVYWYVVEGDISHAKIWKPEEANVQLSFDTTGKYTIRVIARFTQPGTPVQYKDCDIIVL